jgi:hypothetical protein
MTKYHEDVYPAEMIVSSCDVFVYANWLNTKHWIRPANMKVMMFWWRNKEDDVVAMNHQSLQ